MVYTSLSSPLGTLWIAAGERGLVQVSFGIDEAEVCHGIEGRGYGMPEYDPEGLPEAVMQFAGYFAGERKTFDLPVDLSRVTPFQRKVLEVVRDIPYGEVRSYGEVARAAGNPRAARAVGTVMATNPVSLVIPCHRVIRGDGAPGDYARATLGSCGVSYKRLLQGLEREAIQT